MANILLTQRCVRSCPYCFAKKQMADSNEDEVMAWQDFIYLIDLMESSGENHISLLGGEPTLHPHFTDFVVYLLERNFCVNVFTSGIISEATFEDMNQRLSGVHPERLSYICNINDPKKSNFSELEHVTRFLKHFGHQVSPGFNIYNTDFEMEFIFDYINRYGLKRFLRLGLAHPIPGKKNMYVSIEDLPKMIKRLMHYAPMFERFRVKIGLDCGFPLCLFTSEELGIMYRNSGGRLVFGCGPAVDFGPDMTVWSCFPLSDFAKKSVYEFDSLHDIRRFYEDKHRTIRSEVAGIFEACDMCNYREDMLCLGGCLAHSLNHFKNEAHIRLEEIYT